ncbi:MAG: glycosidase [Oligosphaeraceae bacterium]|nr:glycosidase [Oligosphaeraceae bacterium]
MQYQSSHIIRRHHGNPILTYKNIPYEAELVFNAGVIKYQGKYIMAFRNDVGDLQAPGNKSSWKWRSTVIGLAYSDDGIHWEAEKEPIELDYDRKMFYSAYDPRLTVIEGLPTLCFAMNSVYGLCGGIATTDDFHHFKVQTYTMPDNRNLVLFPEKLNGNYLRMDRPLNMYSLGGREGFNIWLSESPDLVYWGKNRMLLSCDQVPFGSLKIGPGAPPVRTEKGFLVLYHAVHYSEAPLNAYSDWHKVYSIGAMLLDAENPYRIIGMGKEPLLYPEMPYECAGFRGSTLFPGAVIPEEDGSVKIYYGAADTVECLATAAMDDLLKFCLES